MYWFKTFPKEKCGKICEIVYYETMKLFNYMNDALWHWHIQSTAFRFQQVIKTINAWMHGNNVLATYRLLNLQLYKYLWHYSLIPCRSWSDNMMFLSFFCFIVIYFCPVILSEILANCFSKDFVLMRVFECVRACVYACVYVQNREIMIKMTLKCLVWKYDLISK